jgi:hypothetical protein
MTESARDSYGGRRWTAMSSPAIHDFVPGRCSDSHGPAEMMGDPHAHTLDYLASPLMRTAVFATRP